MTPSRLIASLSVLRANWDFKRTDFLETHVPFLANLLLKDDIDEIDINKIAAISQRLKEEYGLNVPFHPLTTLINRARQRGLLRKIGGHYYVEKPTLQKYDFRVDTAVYEREYLALRADFIAFSEKKHQVKISDVEADSLFVILLRRNDLGILFLARDNTLKQEYDLGKSAKKLQHLINEYILHLQATGSPLLDSLVRAAVGNIISNAIQCTDYSWSMDTLRGCDLYMDTRIIFRLLGIEGDFFKQSYADLLAAIGSLGGRLCLFTHTRDEIMTILDNCLRLINNAIYDPAKASLTLRYFVQQGYSESDVITFIGKLSATLERHKIETHVKPQYLEFKFWQIDEKELATEIEATYKGTNPFFRIEDIESTIQRDIDSISAIYRLRKDENPRLIKDAKHIFVTTNYSLAAANKNLERRHDVPDQNIPACVTDNFLGTLVWLHRPEIVDNVNRLKLIAETNAAFKPDSSFIGRLIHQAELLSNRKDISEEDLLILKTSPIAAELMNEKTLGDPDAITGESTLELLEIIKNKYAKAERERGEEKIADLRQREEALLPYRERIDRIEAHIKKIAIVVAKTLSYLCMIVFACATVAGVFMQFLSSFPRLWWRIVSLVVITGLGSASTLIGFSISKIEGKVEKAVSSLLKKSFGLI